MDYDILLLLILNSLYIFGFANSTQYGLTVDKTPDDKELLWFIRWRLRNAPAWIKNPLFDCVICMASLHSFPYLIFYHDLTLTNGATYIIYIFALSGFNKFVHDRVS